MRRWGGNDLDRSISYNLTSLCIRFLQRALFKGRLQNNSIHIKSFLLVGKAHSKLLQSGNNQILFYKSTSGEGKVDQLICACHTSLRAWVGSLAPTWDARQGDTCTCNPTQGDMCTCNPKEGDVCTRSPRQDDVCTCSPRQGDMCTCNPSLGEVETGGSLSLLARLSS